MVGCAHCGHAGEGLPHSVKIPTCIAVAFVCFSGLVLPGLAEANDEGLPTYSFQSIAWTLRENFGFQVGLLKGGDGGLIGLSLRLWNNSTETPLALRTLGRFSTPFAAEIRINDGARIVARARMQRTTASKEPSATQLEWTLAPRAVEYFFVPASEFFPSGFDPPITQNGKVWVYVTTQTKSVSFSLEHEPLRLPYTEIMVTRASLALDAQAVFRDWCKHPGQSR